MTNVHRYNINYAKWIIQHIPIALRTNEMIAWLSMLCLPMVSIYNKVLSFRITKLYELAITPQVCFLEKMLNDRYDNSLRRIYITDGIDFTPTYDYLEAEARPDWLYLESEAPAQYDFLEAEVGAVTYDFKVHVPASISFDVNEMKGLINNYKLASKLYTIQTF